MANSNKPQFHHAAGIAWLHDLKPPPKVLLLTKIGEMYFNRPGKISKDWRRKMLRMWREFVELIGVEYVDDLTPELVHAYGDRVLQCHETDGKSPTYVAHRFCCVHTVLNKVRARLSNPAVIDRALAMVRSLEPPDSVGADPRPISREHYRKLLEAVEGKPKWKAVLLFALNAAMYPSEVAAVMRKHINLDERTFMMQRGKTKIPRTAILWHRTTDAIRDYQIKEPHESEYVFVSQTGAPYNANHMSRNFRRRREEAGLPESIQFAHIRDGAYTAAFRAPAVDERMARLIAGHSTGMSDFYVKRDLTIAAEACQAIERYYFGDPPTGSSGDSG